MLPWLLLEVDLPWQSNLSVLMPQLTNNVDEREILKWLESVTGDEFATKPLQEALKDGTVLCK